MRLREALATKGVKKLSVTALLGLARNTTGLEFDKQTITGATVPDVAGIEMKLDELLDRLAKKQASERRSAPADIEPAAPTYNHTRGDSPLTPCPECAVRVNERGRHAAEDGR